VPAKGCGDQIVTRGKKLEVMHAARSICPQLDLALRIPAAVVSDHGNKRQATSNSRFELRQMKSETAISQDCKDRRLRLRVAGGQGQGERTSDSPRDTIHESPSHGEHALRPLPKLTTVADEDGVRVALDIGF